MICVFVFAYVKCLFSHDAAHLLTYGIHVCQSQFHVLTESLYVAQIKQGTSCRAFLFSCNFEIKSEEISFYMAVNKFINVKSCWIFNE